ncbi:MAG: CotH kinase family protein, partial [Erysipelotrichaceae bacterium]|nr:CotH kinase family protein [Erysipelotrichaceae bacterium]
MEQGTVMMKKYIVSAMILLMCITGCRFIPGQTEKELNYEDNGLPVLYLQIDPEEFTKVNESADHSYRAEGATLSIGVPEGYANEYADEISGVDSLKLDYIRGRGHGTWEADKKPYRFKLEDKAELLGMDANKHWVLLANRYDTTMIRNRIISYIGERMGLAYTPKSVPVELVVNGEYYGSYVLSEQVRIDENRIAIDELKPEAIFEPEISGGYLLCLNPAYDEALENVYLSDRNVRFGNEEPQFSQDEDGVIEQKEYISDYLQKTEDAIFSETFADDSGKPYDELMDLRSTADYWWIQEFSGNHDAFITSSTYLYKEREGKLYWGPLWDFDLSLGNGLDAVDGFVHRNMSWLNHLRAHEPVYQQLLRQRWDVLDPIISDLVKEDGVIDQLAEEIEKSWKDDQRRWPIIDENGKTLRQDFHEEVEQMKSWMKRRQEWIRANIDQELYHIFDTVTYMADGKIFKTQETPHGYPLEKTPQAPYKEGYVFSHWTDENGKTYEGERIQNDCTLHAVYLTREEAGVTQGIYFGNPKEVWVDIHNKFTWPAYELYPEDTIDKNIRWNSSDPETAEIDEEGTIRLKKTGETTIEGALCTGATNSYVLHIYDSLIDQMGTIKGLSVEEETFIMNKDEVKQIRVSVYPSFSSCNLLFSSDDETVATVD